MFSILCVENQFLHARVNDNPQPSSAPVNVVAANAPVIQKDTNAKNQLLAQNDQQKSVKNQANQMKLVPFGNTKTVRLSERIITSHQATTSKRNVSVRKDILLNLVPIQTKSKSFSNMNQLEFNASSCPKVRRRRFISSDSDDDNNLPSDLLIKRSKVEPENKIIVAPVRKTASARKAGKAVWPSRAIAIKDENKVEQTVKSRSVHNMK